MTCYVYVNGRIVKYHIGSRKQCEQYQLGAVEGLEVSGARLFLDEDTRMWHGWTTVGKPVLVFIA